jgi:hypothetical protein
MSASITATPGETVARSTHRASICSRPRRFLAWDCRSTYGGGASALGATGSVSTRLNGFFSGGQVGYNWQFSDRFVAGLEADLQGAGVRGDGGFTNLTPAAVYPPFIAATSVTVHRSQNFVRRHSA